MKTNTKEVLTSSFPKKRKGTIEIQGISNTQTEVKITSAPLQTRGKKKEI